MALVAVSGLLQACGRGDRAPTHDDNAGSGSSAAVAIATEKHGPLGVDHIARFNFVYGDGAAAYAKALTASKAKPPDWTAVRDSCAAALAKDPSHLDAEFLLGQALVQLGDTKDAAVHFATALAGDYGAYADRDRKSVV